MAIKAQSQTAEATDRREAMEFRIEGLEQISAMDNVFRLTGVKPIEFPHQEILDSLKNAGVAEPDAIYLMEQFGTMVFEHQIAKVLAKRMTRVG